MKRLEIKMLIGGLCCALSIGSWAATSTSAGSFESQHLQSRLSEITLPDSCKSPYRDSPNFIESYSTSIAVIATQRGAQANGVSELFAVMSLRDKMRDLFPSLGEESPLDRLIVAQLCLFEKVQMEKYGRPGQAPVVIAPANEELQTHLVSIAPRLYQDSRKLMIDALAVRAKEQKQNLNLQRQWDEVRRAREKGDEKVADLVREVN